MELIIAGFELAFTPLTLFVILCGTAFGIVVGAVPGIGGVLGLAVVIPVAISLPQVPSIALLLGVYCGSIYGGMFSAVLINTPGTAASAATVFDGYTMAQRGQAGLALGWATGASVFGGLFSLLVLMIAAPQLAAFALRFSPIEIFALMLVALTCIATLSRGSMVKGVLAAAIGIMLSMPGSDPMTGEVRYTFGIFALSGGFDLIPVLIGLFALSEVFERVATKGRSVPPAATRAGMEFAPLKDWIVRLPVLLRSSVLGTFLGILPGIGATTASFLGYAQAKETSPRREKMGQGEPDGVIGPEAANNAVTGGALIPTLALGIPGDPNTAMMMATLLMQGIVPGVRLFADNPELVYASFAALIIVNIMMGVLGWSMATAFTWLLRIPQPVLLSTVVVLSLLGAYTIRQNEFDLFVAIAAGVVGLLMRVNGFPLAPAVIGLVLGAQFEENLRMALILTDGSIYGFFERPIAAVLIFITIGLLGYPVIKDYIGIRRARNEGNL